MTEQQHQEASHVVVHRNSIPPIPSTNLPTSEEDHMLSVKQLVQSYHHVTFSKLQTVERLTRIPGFIPDRIFPFLCGRDQLQLANSSPVLLRELHHDLPPKLICAKCLKTLISSPVLPGDVRFLLSHSRECATAAIALCNQIPQDPLDCDQMQWAREKFFLGEQQYKGVPVLHCKRCRNVVAVLFVRPLRAPNSPKFNNWLENVAHISDAEARSNQFTQVIVAIAAGTKIVNS